MKLPSAPPGLSELSDPPVDRSADPWARVRSALARSRWARSTDRGALVVAINGRGQVRLELRAAYAERLRRTDATLAFLVANETPGRSGAVVVVDRTGDEPHVLVVDIEPGAAG
jgi:hypothetical protein